MPIPRYAAKIDATQPAIVQALERCGIQVWKLEKPLDLLVNHRGRTLLIECKSEGGSFTTEQAKFLAYWTGEVHICRTPDEALRAVLGPEHCDLSFIDTDAPKDVAMRVVPIGTDFDKDVPS